MCVKSKVKSIRVHLQNTHNVPLETGKKRTRTRKRRIKSEEDEEGQEDGDEEEEDEEEDEERSEEHTSELQSRLHLVCRLLLEKKKTSNNSR